MVIVFNIYQTEIPLIVYDSIECRNAEYVPSKQSSSDRVQYLVCFNRGTIQLTTRYDSLITTCTCKNM